MPESRTAEEWAEYCASEQGGPAHHGPYTDSMCLKCVGIYTAQQTAELQTEHDSYVAELKAALDTRNAEADALHDDLAVLRRAVGGALDCLPGCDAEAHEEDCPAADPAEGYRTLERERDALRAVAKAAQRFVERSKVDRSSLRAELLTLVGVETHEQAIQASRRARVEMEDALAHPVVQRAIK